MHRALGKNFSLIVSIKVYVAGLGKFLSRKTFYVHGTCTYICYKHNFYFYAGLAICEFLRVAERERYVCKSN